MRSLLYITIWLFYCQHTYSQLSDTASLKTVIVRAAKTVYQQKPEGAVINVENSVLSKGSSVLEVLERSPGVAIDHRNNTIILNGKSGIVVMLDGKLMRMPVEQVTSLLSSMSANDIEKIELLTTPSAGYDADGTAGIINIVLKKNRKQGTNGSVSATAGYGWGEKATATIHLAHNTKNTSIYGTYSYSRDHTNSNMFITSSQNMPVFGGQLHVLAWDTAEVIQNNHDFTLGFNRKLNSTITIGGSINRNNSVRLSNDFNDLNFTVLPDSVLFYHGYISGTNKWNNLIGSVNTETILRQGEKINVDLDYLRFTNHNPSTVQSVFLNKYGEQAGNNDSTFSPVQKGFANTIIQVGVMKIDYTKSLNNKTKLETGIKGTYTYNVSNAGIESLVNGAWVNRSETINNMVMKESIGAIYASLTTEIKTATVVVGARYEYTSTSMNDPLTAKSIVNRKQGVLFPNLLLSKKLSDKSSLFLSYTKRISRPSYNDLAAFIRYSDPTAVYSGNPLLKPTITHNLKAGYNYRDYSVSVMLSRDNYPIVGYQISESAQNDLLYISPQNLTWQNNIGLTVNMPFTINNFWTMSYGATAGWKQFKATYSPEPVQKTYFAWSGNASESFRLPHNFFAEISAWYNSIFYNGTIKVGGMGAVNTGIKKELNNNWGTLHLSASNVLRTLKINSFYGTITQEAFSIKNHVHINTESQTFPIIKLTWSKPFGMAAQSQNKQNAGYKDEQDRIKY